MDYPREEIEATVTRYLAFRRAVDDGGARWEELDQFFTEDAVFVDPAWGRVEGLDEVRKFWVDSMIGLEEWKFPIEFVAIEGCNVVVKWLEVMPGRRADGSPIQQSGYSTLIYAGDGKFSYEEDVVNMAHVFEDMSSTTWQPQPGMVPPPEKPNRDFSRPNDVSVEGEIGAG